MPSGLQAPQGLLNRFVGVFRLIHMMPRALHPHDVQSTVHQSSRGQDDMSSYAAFDCFTTFVLLRFLTSKDPHLLTSRCGNTTFLRG